jgi:hypothetical protein
MNLIFFALFVILQFASKLQDGLTTAAGTARSGCRARDQRQQSLSAFSHVM